MTEKLGQPHEVVAVVINFLHERNEADRRDCICKVPRKAISGEF
jgi:hypothetical protein